MVPSGNKLLLRAVWPNVMMPYGITMLLCINSLRRNAAYMHLEIRSTLDHIRACLLFGAKPLSDPMLDHYTPHTTKLLGRSVLPSFCPSCMPVCSMAQWICFMCGTNTTHEGQCDTCHFQVNRSKVKFTWVVQIFVHVCSMARWLFDGFAWYHMWH